MVQGYKIYSYERDVLIRQRMSNGTKYNPIKDINGDYFIFEEEHRQCGLGIMTEFIEPEVQPL